MVEQLSPLGAAWKPGRHNVAGTAPAVTLAETRPGSIVQVNAWHGQEKAVMAALQKAAGLKLPDGAGGGVAAEHKAAFGFAPGKFLVATQIEGIGAELRKLVPADIGTVTDLSHGRTALRVAGPKAEWVLQKLYGRSTTHHDIFTQVQRTGPDQFDLYVFRSFARAFWKTLCHAAAEVGYEVR
jgi:heterotetrameric sarcosine oxidase gamma subunit